MALKYALGMRHHSQLLLNNRTIVVARCCDIVERLSFFPASMFQSCPLRKYSSKYERMHSSP